jgi:hypothetical protein
MIDDSIGIWFAPGYNQDEIDMPEMMDEDEKPLPCPFCGESDPEMVWETAGRRWKCCCCETEGPPSRVDPTRTWNTRPNLTPAAPDGLVERLRVSAKWLASFVRDNVSFTGYDLAKIHCAEKHREEVAEAAEPTDPALLAENERLKALLGEADCLTINKGRTITIDFADTQAAGKLFAALQSMHLAKLPQS